MLWQLVEVAVMSCRLGHQYDGISIFFKLLVFHRTNRDLGLIAYYIPDLVAMINNTSWSNSLLLGLGVTRLVPNYSFNSGTSPIVEQ